MIPEHKVLRQVAEALYTVYFRLDTNSPFGQLMKAHADLCNIALPTEHVITDEALAQMRQKASIPEIEYLNQQADKATPGEYGHPLRWDWDDDCVYVHNAAMLPKNTPATLMFVIHAHQADAAQMVKVRRIIDRMLTIGNYCMKGSGHVEAV